MKALGIILRLLLLPPPPPSPTPSPHLPCCARRSIRPFLPARSVSILSSSDCSVINRPPTYVGSSDRQAATQQATWCDQACDGRAACVCALRWLLGTCTHLRLRGAPPPPPEDLAGPMLNHTHQSSPPHLCAGISSSRSSSMPVPGLVVSEACASAARAFKAYFLRMNELRSADRSDHACASTSPGTWSTTLGRGCRPTGVNPPPSVRARDQL